ncbi:MAG: transketolase [Candidatus Terrybacteria bacterium RIFCSPLOWO2_01_FULL_58_14]|uniref:Transketolase n=2 Tax=Candidatus Terryibacteriota TaxID=1817920 RepID=A0A1G2PYR7_9BACT|nr:MAG: transketolase [Candidatus Terrybacteria bacterium RIFCSPHIGHO2_01_FULL_58_15]OHA53466.1 MAG: transketolase [Candidatus Terrybacteria bacterium RIFCSPLOWO2_01_FULL_58_14]
MAKILSGLLANDTLYDREKVERVPTRNGYGEGLLELGKRRAEVVVLCADLTESTRVEAFTKAFPERFIEMGVAEQNMASVASGLAAVGKIPFIASYAVFSPGRNWEQIRTTICYNEQPVKIGGAHTGVSVGPDGATHQALEDIAIMRTLPHMIVVVPGDVHEARKATIAAVDIPGPVYLRFAREKTPVFTVPDAPFAIGKASVLRDGDDVALIACGPLVYEALLAAHALEREGIAARVINNATVKPMDTETIIAAAQECGAVVTAEEHQIAGGMGSAVAEVLAKERPVPMEFIGMQDRFGESGSPDTLMDEFGLRAQDVVAAAKRAIARKKAGL